jgi:hypothetical protein
VQLLPPIPSLEFQRNSSKKSSGTLLIKSWLTGQSIFFRVAAFDQKRNFFDVLRHAEQAEILGRPRASKVLICIVVNLLQEVIADGFIGTG